MIIWLLTHMALLGGGDIERAFAILDRLESTTITVEYTDEPVSSVLADLERLSEVPIRGDWDAMIRLGIDEDDELSFRMRDTDALTVLRALALTLGDEFERPIFEVHAGQVVLTSVEATKEMRLLDVYDVRDLLGQPDLIETLRRERPPLPIEIKEEDETAEPSDEKPMEFPVEVPPVDMPPLEVPQSSPPMSPGHELMLLLIDHVDPEAWLEYGGNLARIDERDGVLLVTAAPSVHRLMRDALRRLRRTNPSRVEIDISLVDLPRRQFELITQRFIRGSAAYLEALRRNHLGLELWKTSSVVAMTGLYEVDSIRDGISIHLELTPTRDSSRGLIMLEVGIETNHDDDERRVRTTLTFTQGLPGGVIELPAAHAEERIRLLLLTISPR